MKIDLLGVKIDALKKTEILQKIGSDLRLDKSIFIVTPYSESIVAAQSDLEFRNILNSADIALPDGIGILWAAHYLKYGKMFRSLFSIFFNSKKIRDPIPEKISGSGFIWDLAKLAANSNCSVFLLGGFDDTPDIVARELKSKFPNIQIAGIYPGTPQEQRIVEKINTSAADFLFVAFGPVKQEKWIYESLPNLRVKLAIGLGGAFDYIARKRPSAPRFWASRGLEWLWRLLTQPWRLYRIFKGIIGLIYYSFVFKLK